MTVGTGAIGITPDGQVQVYVPPNVIQVTPPDLGYAVEYGPPVTITDGQPLLPGIWRIQSGMLLASGDVVVQPVTITPL